MAQRTVLILTGEPSGDAAGAGLAAALRRRDPGVRILAVGGSRLRAEGVEIVRDIAELSAMGFVEVVRQIPRLKRLERELRERIERERPDVIVPIDYPGFHLRVARWARTLGPRIVYYIGPQVWAWGARRIPKIAAVVDRMLVVLPFEADLYRSVDLQTDYVGHPLVAATADPPSGENVRAELVAPAGVPVLALLAGSRLQEVRRILPVLVETARRARERRPELRVVASVSRDVDPAEYAAARDGGIHLSTASAAEIIRAADAVLVTSGTATLETALLGRPLAVLYKTSPITWGIGRRVVKIPRISLANIVAGEDVAPEFLQGDATADQVLPWVEATLSDPGARDRAEEVRRRLRQVLGDTDASDEAARIVLEECAR